MCFELIFTSCIQLIKSHFKKNSPEEVLLIYKAKIKLFELNRFHQQDQCQTSTHRTFLRSFHDGLT